MSQARQGMSKYPQILINVPLHSPEHLEHPSVIQAVQSVEDQLGDSGRVVLRPSGTESVVRVMVEGVNADEVQTCAEEIASSVEKVASIG